MNCAAFSCITFTMYITNILNVQFILLIYSVSQVFIFLQEVNSELIQVDFEFFFLGCQLIWYVLCHFLYLFDYVLVLMEEFWG